MSFKIRRLSRWVTVASVGAGIAALVGSSAYATTLLWNIFQISFDPGVQTSPDIAIATKGGNGPFLSIWDESSSTTNGEVVYGQLVSQGGVPTGSEIAIAPLAAGVDDTRPRVAYSPTRDSFMVVWEDNRNGATSGTDIYAQEVSSNGALLGANIPISTATNNQQRPAIAYNSLKDEYLVVWADWRNLATTNVDIYGQLITSSGALVGSNFVISNARNIQDMSRVAFDPVRGQYLVVWSDGRTAADGYDIYGQKVGLSGKLVGGPILISNAPYDQFRPDITWDANDSEFMAVWVDCRNIGTPGCVSGIKTNGDIYGQVIASGGTLVGSNFPIATTTNSEYRPAVSFSATSDLFQVMYSDQPNTSNTGQSQIWGVEVTPGGTLVGPNMPLTPTPSGSIQERASIAWNPTSNDFLLDFVNQAATANPQNIWGQFLLP